MKRLAATAMLAAALLAARPVPAVARSLTESTARNLRAVRVVLTWRSACDLDLHVVHPAGAGRLLHIWESGAAAEGVVLHVEPTVGPGGMESAFIPEPDGGIYQFYVHDRSCRHAADGSGVSHSGATVRVFSPRCEREYSPSEGRRENLWSVFALLDGGCEALGNMSQERDPRRVGERPDSALLPGDILLGGIPDSLVPGRWSHVAIYAGEGVIIEAPSEDSRVTRRRVSDWTSPAIRWVKYLRVTTADRATRNRAVRFALEQERAGGPYDIGFHSKQADGESWYCSELVWAAYVKASGGAINLERTPDRLGVYPWEIAGDDDVAVIGGHYEKKPRRSIRVVKLAFDTVRDHLSEWIGDLFSSRD